MTAVVFGLVHQFTLLRGGADYMEGQGCPETAREGRTAAVLSVVANVGVFVAAIIAVVILMVSSLALSLVVLFAVLAVTVIAIIALISRLSFFYKSAKRLKDGIMEIPLQDRKEQKNEETSQ